MVVAVTGRRPGRPRDCPRELLIRIVRLRQSGVSQADICRMLNAEGVPTARGGPHWWPSYVCRLLSTYDAQLLMDGHDLPPER
jgi:hypothetical protein